MSRVAAKTFTIQDPDNPGIRIRYRPGDEVDDAHLDQIGEHCLVSENEDEEGAEEPDGLEKRTVPQLLDLARERGVQLGSRDNKKARIIQKLREAAEEAVNEDGDGPD